MLSAKQEVLVEGSMEEIRAKLAQAQQFLTDLEDGSLHIGLPFEGRTEAKIHALRRDIAIYEKILKHRDAERD